MFVPALVSEREAGEWEDCVWSSGVAFANGVAGADIHPATRAEYEGLRFDATGVREGHGDGSNLRELAIGLAERYGLTAVKRGGGWADAMTACPVGRYLVVQGSCAGLPARLQVTDYRGPHCALWCRTGSFTGAWLDPLNRAGATPRAASIDEVRAFYETLPGAEWLVNTGGSDMPGVPVAIDARYDGTCRVVGDGHSFINTSTGDNVPVPDGWPGPDGKEVYALGHLYRDHTLPGGGVIRTGTEIVIVGVNEAVLLRRDVELTARPPADVQHTVSVLVDDDPVWTGRV